MAEDTIPKSFFWSEDVGLRDEFAIDVQDYHFSNYNYLYGRLEKILKCIEREFKKRKYIIPLVLPGESGPLPNFLTWYWFIRAFLECEDELLSITNMSEFFELTRLCPLIKKEQLRLGGRLNANKVKEVFGISLDGNTRFVDVEEDLKLDPYKLGKTYFTKDEEWLTKKQLEILAEDHIKFNNTPSVVFLFNLFQIVRNNNSHEVPKLPAFNPRTSEQRRSKVRKLEDYYNRGQCIVQLLFPLLRECVRVLNNKQFLVDDNPVFKSAEWSGKHLIIVL